MIPGSGKEVAYTVLLMTIALFGGIRMRLLTMPLERDEGEYAYAGQLILQHIVPYKLAYTMKLPGTAAMYAGIMAVFGQTPAGIHAGLLLVNLGTILLVYLLGTRLSGRLTGVVAAASYGLLSTSFSVLGLAAHATHFVAFFAVAGVLVLLRAIDSGRFWHFFAAGLLLGMAFLMKQPGLAFGVFGLLYLLQNAWQQSDWRKPVAWKILLAKSGCYVAGVALPFILTCIVLKATGDFKTFWFWVFTYASQYTSEISFGFGVQMLFRNFGKVAAPAFGVWIIAAVGLAGLRWQGEGRQRAIFIAGLLGFSFLAVSPGLFFRDHYFILMLPAVSVLAGMGVQWGMERLAGGKSAALAAVPVLVFVAACGYALAEQKEMLFEMDPAAACRLKYSSNPFTEAPVIAQYLAAHTAPDEAVAVLGSEPEIYFYAKRHSATGFIYVYGLMERQKYALEMQKQMMQEIESARPRYVVFAKSRLSWMPHEGSPEAAAMSAWIGKFLSDYELVASAERLGSRTEYRYDDDARAYKTQSQNIVGVFKRKS